jgi:PAS domain S-box-containing protein
LEKRLFSQEDSYFLQSVANLLASAVIRARSEESIRSSNNQLAIILQGVSDGVIVQDQNGNIVYANNTAAQRMGFENTQDLIASNINSLTEKFEIWDEEGKTYPLDKLPGRAALRGEGENTATIRFKEHQTGDERWSLLRATPVYNSTGEVELAVNIFQDITEYKRTEQSRHLLAEAGSLLTSSLDIAEILQRIARLAVKHLADWCVVYLAEEDREPYAAAVFHKDPTKVQLAFNLQQRYPPNWDAPVGVAAVLKDGRAEFIPHISEELIEARAQSAEHFDLIRKLGLRAAMTLPLMGRGRTAGAMTLVWAEMDRSYSQYDIVLAEELARIASLAIDNAYLYREAQNMNSSLEARVTKRTSQLQTTITLLKNEITERKKAEEALRESEKMLESLFESAPDATLLVNLEGKIIRVNEQAELIFGHPRQELLELSIDDLLPQRFRGRHMLHRKAYMEAMERRPMGAGLELFGKRANDEEFPIDIMLSPVETVKGPLVICAVRDISDRKQMEAELSEVQGRLIESIEAERLHIAQELHDGPIQELYGISFYLNSLALALDEGSLKNLQETQGLVSEIIGSLRALCSDLRPPSLAPFGLEKAIRAHLETIDEANPELKVKLYLKPDEQLLPERTRLALFRIYQHAVSNVIRHAQANLLEVRLDFDENELELRISDNGKGFKLPARWVEMARKGHLGLVGTVERAEALGARLKIDTAPGKGTSITVSLPLSGEHKSPYSRNWLDRMY